MAVVGSAEVLIRPSFKGFQSASKAAGVDAGKRAGTSLGDNLKKWGKRGAAVAGGAIAGVVGTSLVKGFGRLKAIENAEAKLRGLGHTAGTVQSIMDDALAAVKGTAFGMDEAATAAASAVAAGVKPGKELESYLRLVGDAATIAGTDMSSMGSIFGKVMTSSKAQGDVFKQLGDQGIPIVTMLAEKLGISAAEVYELGSAGEITSADFLDAMSSMEGAALEGGNTTEGAFKNMGAALGRVGANLLSGVFPKFKEVFSGITQWLDPIESKAKVVGEAISNWLGGAAETVQKFFSQLSSGEGAGGKFMNFLDKVRDLGMEVWSWLNQHIVPAMKTFADTVGGAVVDAAQWLWEKLQALSKWFRDNESQIRNIASVVGGVLHGAITGAGDAIAWLIRTGRKLGDWLIDNRKLVLVAVGAYASWKLVMAGVTFGRFIAGLVKSSAAWVKETAAVVANTIAKVKSKAETVALAAMLAKDWLVAQARSIAGWIRETAAMVAHRAASIAAAAATKAMAVAQNAAAVAGKALNAVLRANPIGLVVTLLVGLVAAFVAAYKKSETFRKIVDGAWQGIKKAAEAVWNFLKKYVFAPIVAYYKTLWDAAVKAKDLIVGAWNTMKGALKAGWDWIKSNVFDLFTAGVGALRQSFTAQVDRMKSVWGGIKSSFKAVWDWVKTNVFDRFSGGITNLKDNVIKGVKLIGDGWKRIANLFRNPINWVLNKVWNGGIAKAFNSAAGAIGIKTRLSTEAQIPAFAKGGYHKGGWALVGEEGPELVNFSHPGRVYTADETRAALAGDGGQGAMGDGTKDKSWYSKAWDGVKSAASAVTGWVRGGLAKAAELLLNPVKRLITSTVGQWGAIGNFAGGAMTVGIDGLLDWIRGKDEIEAPAIGGSGWARPSRGPVTSRYGPRSLFGGSFHAGVDIAGGGPTYAAGPGVVKAAGWNILGGRTGIGIGIDHGGGVFTYYGHNPSMSAVKVRPGDAVKAGQRIGAQGATGNVTGTHLHFELHKGGWGRAVNPDQLGLFDNGGLLQPGAMAYHSSRMSKPDAVLTARQWADIHRLATRGGGGDTYNVTVDADLSQIRNVADFERLLGDARRLARQKAGV